MSVRTTRLELRVASAEKEAWRREAEELNVTVSELVRTRMSVIDEPTMTQGVRVDLDASELQSLRSWLDLADSDGEVDGDQLESWKAFAADRDIGFDELLARTAVYANLQHV